MGRAGSRLQKDKQVRDAMWDWSREEGDLDMERGRIF